MPTVRGDADILRVNEAWRVLRDPTLRRQYDATLRKPPPLPLGFEDREGWGAIFDPVFAPVPPRPRRPVWARHPPRHVGPVPLRWLVLVGVLAVAAAIVVFTAYAGGATNAPRVTVPAATPAGSCITIPAGQAAKVVPCGQANDGVVVAPGSDPGYCPMGAVARASRPGGPADLCLAPH